MNWKILIISIFLSFNSLANIGPYKNVEDVEDTYASSSVNENADKLYLKLNGVKFKDIKLKELNLVEKDGSAYVLGTYLLTVMYNYKDAKILRGKTVYLLHPVLEEDGKFALPDPKEYFKLITIYFENDSADFKRIRKIENTKKLDDETTKEFHKIFDDNLKDNNDQKKDDDESSEVILKVLPYIQLDSEGYAYIKGTDRKLTSESNPIIEYYPKEKQSVVEFGDFINGVFVPKISKIKNGEEQEFGDLVSDKNGTEYIKHTTISYENGLEYKNEEIIAELKFEDGKLVDCKILP